jgi:threonine synthase
MRVLCSDCAHEVPIGTLGRCPMCGGILRPEYPDEAIRQLHSIAPGRGINRYQALLPVRSQIPCLGEGDTPLLASRRLGRALGLEHLYFKNEGLNPTGAFKDRAGALVTALALDAGAHGVLSASSGNASSAIAAYCAAAGLKCVILMEPGNPAAKMRQTLATGARVLLVDGVFAHGPQALTDLLMAVAERSGYYVGFVWAPVNPYILEGIKTISYEIAAHLTHAPDAVIAPVGGGDMFAAQWRGWLELHRAGVIERLPRMIGVQSVSAPPLLEAFRTGTAHVGTLPYANSKISGINVPFTGDHALAAVRESGGTVAGVTDDEVLAMQARLATEEGIWVEPAGAAAATAVRGLLERGDLRPDEHVVCVSSGAGFKDANLAADQAQAIGQQASVVFDVEAISAEL